MRILTVNAGSTGLKLHVVENGESTRVEELVDAYAVGHRVVHGGERFVQPVAVHERRAGGFRPQLFPYTPRLERLMAFYRRLRHPSRGAPRGWGG